MFQCVDHKISFLKRPGFILLCSIWRIHISLPNTVGIQEELCWHSLLYDEYACAGSDGNMSASGSAGPGFDLRWGRKFSFENFQPRG